MLTDNKKITSRETRTTRRKKKVERDKVVKRVPEA